MAENYSFGLAVQLADEVSRPARKAARGLGVLQAAMESLAGTRDPFERMGDAAAKFASEASAAAQAGRGLGADVREMSREADRAVTAADKLNDRLGGTKRQANAAGTALTSLSTSIAGLAKSAAGQAKAMGGELVGAFKDMVHEGAKFDQQIVFAGVTMNAVGKDFQLIRDEANRLGRTTAFTAYEAAKGFVGLGQAGFNAAQSVKLMQPILELAGGQMISIEKATGLVSQGLKTFGLDASQATRVTDVLARAANASYQTVQDLGVAMKYVGPVAAALGKSIEETAGALSVSADAALRGSMGGTGLRRILTTIITPSKKLDEAMKLLGITMADIDPKTHSIADIMEKLAPLADKTGAAMKLFGDRGGPAFLAMARAQGEINGQWLKGADYMRAMTKQMTEGNSAAKIYATMMDTVQGKLKIFESAVEAVKLSIFRGFQEPLKNAISKVALWIEDLAMVFAKLAPVLLVIVNGAIEAVKRLFGPLTSFLDKSGIGDVFNLLRQDSKETSAVLDQVIEGWTKRVEAYRDRALAAIDDFIGGAKQRWEEMKAFVSGFTTGLEAGFQPLVSVVRIAADVFGFLVERLMGFTQAGTGSTAAAESLGQKIGFLVGIVGSLVAIQLAGWLLGGSVAMGAATVATIKWTAALLLNPATWVVAGIMGIIAALDYLNRKLQSVSNTWKFFMQGPGGMMKEKIAAEEARVADARGNSPASSSIAAAKLAAKEVDGGSAKLVGSALSTATIKDRLMDARVDEANRLAGYILGGGIDDKQRAAYGKELEGVMQRGGGALAGVIGSSGGMASSIQSALAEARAAESRVNAEAMAPKVMPNGSLGEAASKGGGRGKGRGAGRGRGGAGTGAAGAGGRGERNYTSEILGLQERIATGNAWGDDTRQLQLQMQQLQVDRQLAEGKRRKALAEKWGVRPEDIDSNDLEADRKYGGRRGRGLLGAGAGDAAGAQTSLDALDSRAALKRGDGLTGAGGPQTIVFNIQSGAVRIENQGTLDAESLAEKLWPTFKRLVSDESRRAGAS